MTKSEAVELFGSVTKLCKAMGLSRNAYYKWTDPLSQTKADQVIGAYMRNAEDRDKQIVHHLGADMKKVPVRIVLPLDLKLALQEAATADQRTLSSLVHHIIMRRVENEPWLHGFYYKDEEQKKEG